MTRARGGNVQHAADRRGIHGPGGGQVGDGDVGGAGIGGNGLGPGHGRCVDGYRVAAVVRGKHQISGAGGDGNPVVGGIGRGHGQGAGGRGGDDVTFQTGHHIAAGRGAAEGQVGVLGECRRRHRRRGRGALDGGGAAAGGDRRGAAGRRGHGQGAGVARGSDVDRRSLRVGRGLGQRHRRGVVGDHVGRQGLAQIDHQGTDRTAREGQCSRRIDGGRKTESEDIGIGEPAQVGRAAQPDDIVLAGVELAGRGAVLDHQIGVGTIGEHGNVAGVGQRENQPVAQGLGPVVGEGEIGVNRRFGDVGGLNVEDVPLGGIKHDGVEIGRRGRAVVGPKGLGDVGIGAGAAVECIGAGAAVECIGAGAAVDGVVGGAAVDVVGGGVAGDDVGAGATLDLIDVGQGKGREVVVHGSRGENDVVGTGGRSDDRSPRAQVSGGVDRQGRILAVVAVEGYGRNIGERHAGRIQAAGCRYQAAGPARGYVGAVQGRPGQGQRLTGGRGTVEGQRVDIGERDVGRIETARRRHQVVGARARDVGTVQRRPGQHQRIGATAAAVEGHRHDVAQSAAGQIEAGSRGDGVVIVGAGNVDAGEGTAVHRQLLGIGSRLRQIDRGDVAQGAAHQAQVPRGRLDDVVAVRAGDIGAVQGRSGHRQRRRAAPGGVESDGGDVAQRT